MNGRAIVDFKKAEFDFDTNGTCTLIQEDRPFQLSMVRTVHLNLWTSASTPDRLKTVQFRLHPYDSKAMNHIWMTEYDIFLNKWIAFHKSITCDCIFIISLKWHHYNLYNCLRVKDTRGYHLGIILFIEYWINLMELCSLRSWDLGSC